jgi:hypothetical protein
MDRLRTFYVTLGIERNKDQHDKGRLYYAGRVGNLVLEPHPLPDDANVDSSP